MSSQPIIVLDASAFIEGSGLLSLGTTNKLVTTRQVIQELRDVKTRQILQTFPFIIEELQPDKKSIDFIKQFARKTGDLVTLSDVDINLLALTHTLYLQYGLEGQLRKNPLPMKQTIGQKNNQQFQQDLQEQDDDFKQNGQQQQPKINLTEEEQKLANLSINQQNKEPQPHLNKNIQKNPQQQVDDGWIMVPKSKPKKKQQQINDIADTQGWITPKNYQKKISSGMLKFAQSQQQQQQNQQQQQQIKISLITTDYAIQNVAMQIGLAIKSLSGRKIKQVKRFILQCYLCWKQYPIVNNQIKLCKQCGYNSLSKISYTVQTNGQIYLHRKKNWKPNQKILQWKQRKYQQQQKAKKHQKPKKKKYNSIFQT